MGRLTVDGTRYMAMSSRRVAVPFHLRWLLPAICGTNVAAWTAVSRCSVAALGVVACRLIITPGTDPTPYADLLAHPVASARAAHRGQWTLATMVTPWGGLLAGVATLDLRAAVALAAGYGSLLIATDTTRVYQWAWPAVAACTFTGRLSGWAGALIGLAVLINPARGPEAKA